LLQQHPEGHEFLPRDIKYRRALAQHLPQTTQTPARRNYNPASRPSVTYQGLHKPQRKPAPLCPQKTQGRRAIALKAVAPKAAGPKANRSVKN
jgi:hypothetical protein